VFLRGRKLFSHTSYQQSKIAMIAIFFQLFSSFDAFPCRCNLEQNTFLVINTFILKRTNNNEEMCRRVYHTHTQHHLRYKVLPTYDNEQLLLPYHSSIEHRFRLKHVPNNRQKFTSRQPKVSTKKEIDINFILQSILEFQLQTKHKVYPLQAQVVRLIMIESQNRKLFFNKQTTKQTKQTNKKKPLSLAFSFANLIAFSNNG
jgi:hypothetical protein